MQIGISLPVRELQNDLAAIRDFAQTAEELGFTHLRIPDQVARPGAGHLHEPLTLLSWLAGFTDSIQLVPSVIILPARETVLVAKQAAEIDILSNGRLRFGVGVGRSPEEFESLGQDFSTRGRRCDEQIELLKLLWRHETVEFAGRFDQVNGLGINPLPEHEIPIWIGHGPVDDDGALAKPVLRRIARSDGWFAVLPREHFPAAQAEINRFAAAEAAIRPRSASRAPSASPDARQTTGSPTSRRGEPSVPRTSASARSAGASTVRATSRRCARRRTCSTRCSPHTPAREWSPRTDGVRCRHSPSGLSIVTHGATRALHLRQQSGGCPIPPRPCLR